MTRMLIALFCTLLFGTGAASAKTLVVNPDRLITIRGAVDGRILQEADKLVYLTEQSKDPVYIYLNSPGGAVQPGLLFLTAMKVAQSRGVKLRCVSTVLSASMAFQIFAMCDERYAFNNTLLLWHPMKIALMFAALSAEDLAYNHQVIRALEEPMMRDLQRVLKIPERVFWYHYRHETLWTTQWLLTVSPKFVNVITDAKGLPRMFSIQ